MSAGGSFQSARVNLGDKAKKAMFPLFSTIRQFAIATDKSLSLFRSFIQPILLYNSENCAFFSHKQILNITSGKTSLYKCFVDSEHVRMQLKFLKYILGVNKSCTNSMVLGKMGELPVSVCAIFSMLKFWFRVMKATRNLLINQAYRIQDERYEWFNTIAYLLKTLGLDRYRR